MARTLIHLPPAPKRGEVIDIQLTIAHPMETGYRVNDLGQPLPRDILTHFECRYNGRLVFGAELHPAIAANPYIAFALRVAEPGTLAFTWEGDNGFRQTETVALNTASS